MYIGVILPTADAWSTGETPRYVDIKRWGQTAEAVGFDSIWIYDHLLVRRADVQQLGVWEGWTLMVGLAEATSRVQIGSWVVSTGFRNPALLAKMAVTLDEVSNGRLILGLGAGNQRPEFEAFGYDFDHRVSRFGEALAIIAPLLREGHVDFRGTWFSAPDCEIEPRGPRPHGPPILIGADGPRMLRFAARYADMWNAHYLGSPSLLADRRAALDAACSHVGREPEEIETTVGELVTFGDLSLPPPSMTTNLQTTVDGLAHLLGEYERAGVDHLLLQCVPPDFDTALAMLGEALGRYRGFGGLAAPNGAD